MLRAMSGVMRLSETDSYASMARQYAVAGPPGVFSLHFVDHILVHLYDGDDLSCGALQIDCGPARRIALHKVLRCCVRQLVLADIKRVARLTAGGLISSKWSGGIQNARRWRRRLASP